MGRPFKTLGPAQMAEVETLAAVLSAEQMADYFGIGRTTFFALMGREPEIAERCKRGKARAIGTIAQTLISKARAGDTASMIFYLKTQGGWRETQAVEVSGPQGASLSADSAFDKMKQRLNEIAARIRAAEGCNDVVMLESKARPVASG